MFGGNSSFFPAKTFFSSSPWAQGPAALSRLDQRRQRFLAGFPELLSATLRQPLASGATGKACCLSPLMCDVPVNKHMGILPDDGPEPTPAHFHYVYLQTNPKMPF